MIVRRTARRLRQNSRQSTEPSHRLFRLKLPFALALSLLLHLALLFWPATEHAPTVHAPARVEARLQAMRTPEPAPAPDPEPLLKDTLSAAPEAEPAPARTVVPAPRPSPSAVSRARERAQRKLNEHLFYPQEAIDGDLEGVVTLRLLLDDGGHVLEAAVMAGSGHPILDRAALDAARRIGRIDSGGAREILLPVTFRLE